MGRKRNRKNKCQFCKGKGKIKIEAPFDPESPQWIKCINCNPDKNRNKRK